MILQDLFENIQDMALELHATMRYNYFFKDGGRSAFYTDPKFFFLKKFDPDQIRRSGSLAHRPISIKFQHAHAFRVLIRIWF
jgi:hypothetical protein